jgi:Ferritin-like
MPITDVADLRRHLQWAITVEHATIPPYQCAMLSVCDQESEAFLTFKYVVREEMLHMALAANVLAAVGGEPRFAGPDVMPRYPGPMPHHDPDPPLVLHLERASVDLVRDVFLRIEQPELRGSRPQTDRYDTLGQFYDAVSAGIEHLGDDIFTGDPGRQITKGYEGHGGGTLFAVTDAASALRAVEEVVEQGEGSGQAALEPYGFEGAIEPAHYWRFRRIVDGEIPIDEVYPMRRDPRTQDLPGGSLHDLSALFDGAYALQLRVMERVWVEGDASPLIDDALVPLMNHVQKPVAMALLRAPIPDGSGDHAGPPFAWAPMPLAEMRVAADGLAEHFDLGPTVDALDQVAQLTSE